MKNIQNKCCKPTTVEIIGYWYKNYATGFVTKLIQCKVCGNKYSDKGFDNSIYAGMELNGCVTILKDGRVNTYISNKLEKLNLIKRTNDEFSR